MLGLLIALALGGSAAMDCEADRAALIILPYEQFDEAMGHGWRVLAAKPGCEAAAAELIAEYRSKNSAALVEGEPDHIRSLDWHEGQLRATSGQTAAAIALMRRGSRPNDEGGDSLYHAATVAFLERDRSKLLAIMDKIKSMPKPQWFEQVAEQARQNGMKVPPWPVHASEVSGLINCFDKPYSQAYTYACRESR